MIKSISVRVAGGLGNQLFQLAAAISISKKTHLPVSLWLGALSNYRTPRKFGLSEILDINNLVQHVNSRQNILLQSRIARILPGHCFGFWLVSDKNFMQAKTIDGAKSVLMDGYFIESMDQDTFDDAVRRFTAHLIIPQKECQDGRKVCAIHFRGGDFVNLGWISSDIEFYYRKAIDMVLKRDPSVEFFVCTDDQSYAKSLMARIGIEANIRDGSLTQDFWDIASTDFAILSNSTFAFWAGAFRPRSPRGWTTIAPDDWRPGAKRQIRLASEKYCGSAPLNSGNYHHHQ